MTPGRRSRPQKKTISFRNRPEFSQGLKDPNFQGPRLRRKCLNVSDLVYKFLGDVATINADQRQRNNARSNFQRTHVRKSRQSGRRPDAPINTAKSLRRNVKKTGQDLNFCTCTRNVSQLRLKTMMDEQVEQLCDDMEPQEQKLCIRNVESNVRADDKKRYICSALSFGLDAGFLMPTNSNGYIFRVSSVLSMPRVCRNTDGTKEMNASDDESQSEKRKNNRSKRRKSGSNDSSKSRLLNFKSEVSRSKGYRLNAGNRKRSRSEGSGKRKALENGKSSSEFANKKQRIDKSSKYVHPKETSNTKESVTDPADDFLDEDTDTDDENS